MARLDKAIYARLLHRCRCVAQLPAESLSLFRIKKLKICGNKKTDAWAAKWSVIENKGSIFIVADPLDPEDINYKLAVGKNTIEILRKASKFEIAGDAKFCIVINSTIRQSGFSVRELFENLIGQYRNSIRPEEKRLMEHIYTWTRSLGIPTWEEKLQKLTSFQFASVLMVLSDHLKLPLMVDTQYLDTMTISEVDLFFYMSETRFNLNSVSRLVVIGPLKASILNEGRLGRAYRQTLEEFNIEAITKFVIKLQDSNSQSTTSQIAGCTLISTYGIQSFATVNLVSNID